MMTGGGFGTLIGGQIYALVGPYGWRYVMFTGVLPALVLLLIRRGMAEPERFEAVRARRQALRAARDISAEDRAFLSFVPAQLFSRRLATGRSSACCSASARCWRSGPATSGCRRSRARCWRAGHHRRRRGAVDRAWHDAVGSRRDLRLRRVRLHRRCHRAPADHGVLQRRHAGGRAVPVSRPARLAACIRVLLPVFGFFVFGVFSGHAVYLPELFPTHVRATAVSFCNGSGRVITSFGPLVAGLLAGAVRRRFRQGDRGHDLLRRAVDRGDGAGTGDAGENPAALNRPI